MGPIAWELEGPRPIEKSSSTLVHMARPYHEDEPPAETADSLPKGASSYGSQAARHAIRDRRTRRTPLLALIVVIGAAVAAYLVPACGFVRSKSATFDETIYLGLAEQTRGEGRADPRMFHYGVAPLPVWLWHLPVAEARPRRWLLEGRGSDARSIGRARRLALLFAGCTGVAGVAGWLAWRRGPSWGLAAGLLLAWSPSWIAHGALATTDGLFAVATLGVVATLVALVKGPGIATLALTATVMGLALATKYTALVLALPALGLAASAARRMGRASWPVACAAWPLAALLVAWTGHGRLTVPRAPRPENPTAWRPAWWVGLAAQAAHQRNGHRAYLLGRRSTHGWWSYFPIAFFCKSSPSELVAALALVAAGGVGAARGLAARRGGRGRLLRAAFFADPLPYVAATLILALVAALLASRVQIGHRYFLPVYPLLILLIIDRLARGRHRTWMHGAAWLLVGAQAVEAARTSPHYLAYFSPLAGGTSQGHRWLGDSNLDWGQDLVALAAVWRDTPRSTCRLWYFGTADPRAYDPAGDGWPRFSRADLRDGTWQEVAISVTILQAIYEGTPLVE
ncbi:MAG TPA: hypothetical protein ENJ62_06330, partial [Bryobacterales bacterium]|nr:hypothetical protein [Bryobacterales bacterium]